MIERNKIAAALTIEELDAFVSALAAKPGKERTLEAIKHLAAEKGIVISLESARAFRNTTFERHLAKIRTAQEVAMQVESIEAGGNTMAEASAKLLSKRIFSQLIDAEDEDSAQEIDVDSLTLAISRLRRGDQQDRALALAVERFQFDGAEAALAKLKELKAIAADNSLSQPEKIAAVRLKLFGLPRAAQSEAAS